MFLLERVWERCIVGVQIHRIQPAATDHAKYWSVIFVFKTADYLYLYLIISYELVSTWLENPSQHVLAIHQNCSHIENLIVILKFMIRNYQFNIIDEYYWRHVVWILRWTYSCGIYSQDTLLWFIVTIFSSLLQYGGRVCRTSGDKQSHTSTLLGEFIIVCVCVCYAFPLLKPHALLITLLSSFYSLTFRHIILVSSL